MVPNDSALIQNSSINQETYSFVEEKERTLSLGFSGSSIWFSNSIIYINLLVVPI